MTGGHCLALLLAVNPAVDWSQRQGNLQRGCVENATADGGRVSCSTYSATYAQVSQWASYNSPSPTSCTTRWLFACLHLLTDAGVLSGWPPKLWTMKGAHCGQQPMCLLFLRKAWRDITEWCCKAQKSYKPRTHGREGMYETNITEAEEGRYKSKQGD